MVRPADHGEPPHDLRKLVVAVVAMGWLIFVQMITAVTRVMRFALRRIDRSPGPPNLCRLSWWSFAAVVLNVPWVWALLWAIWIMTSSDKPVAGEIFLLPACVWVVSGGPAVACGVVGFAQVIRYEGRLRGKWLSAIGIGIAIIGPALAIGDNIYESLHDSP